MWFHDDPPISCEEETRTTAPLPSREEETRTTAPRPSYGPPKGRDYNAERIESLESSTILPKRCDYVDERQNVMIRRKNLVIACMYDEPLHTEDIVDISHSSALIVRPRESSTSVTLYNGHKIANRLYVTGKLKAMRYKQYYVILYDGWASLHDSTLGFIKYFDPGFRVTKIADDYYNGFTWIDSLTLSNSTQRYIVPDEELP